MAALRSISATLLASLEGKGLSLAPNLSSATTHCQCRCCKPSRKAVLYIFATAAALAFANCFLGLGKIFNIEESR